jgi:phosphoribosylformimino-5-aminoimidazole carboxamide ribotide isomerase
MIAYAAIDLRAGQAVQLVGGRPDAQKIALPDAVAVAQRWMDAGFRALHVIDLDAALGSGDNRTVIGEILNIATVPVQVGGGVRDEETIDSLLEAGATRVIIGTRAIEDAAWRKAMARSHSGHLVVAADVRADFVTTRGWTRETAHTAEAFLRELHEDEIASVLITDVDREGQLLGMDVDRFKRLASCTRHDVIAAGGVRDIEDLRALDGAGVAGAVLGMALYTGTIIASEAAAEFS